MIEYLQTQRRVLVLTYRRYIEADQDWAVATREVRAWFPPATRSAAMPIGSPGSHMRKLYDRRERALQQLAAARQNLAEAKDRLSRRRTVVVNGDWILLPGR